jgi:REP element-mobilizing transposase RayT
MADHLLHHPRKADGVAARPTWRLRTLFRPTTMTAMPPTPLYDPATANPAYQLRYSWTGWLSSGHFERLGDLVGNIGPLWEKDGFRLLEHRCQEEVVQLLFSATPTVSPEIISGRAKGRLDHAARQAGCKLAFSRKLAVRTVGENTRRDAEAYIGRQVGKERFIDPRFEAVMQEFTVSDPNVDLSRPGETARGRYWYNLHLVLVVDGRFRITEPRLLAQLRDATLKVAAKKRHLISRLSVMPDHLHAALRPMPHESPVDVVFAYQNNLAHMLNVGRIWRDSFYAGTFGEYNMQAVRNAVAHERH